MRPIAVGCSLFLILALVVSAAQRTARISKVTFHKEQELSVQPTFSSMSDIPLEVAEPSQPFVEPSLSYTDAGGLLTLRLYDAVLKKERRDPGSDTMAARLG